MLRRSRLEPVGGPRALGVLAASVLVVALVVTGRSVAWRERQPPDPPARPAAADVPYRVGDRLVCPLGRPVLTVSTGRSYPLGHPATPPRAAQPVACYDTAAEAAAAGYPPAPLPAGVRQLDGVYLVPTPARLRRQCRLAAGRLGFAVPCPRLRPVPLASAPPLTLCARRGICGGPDPGFVYEVGGFVAPSGFVGSFRDTGARLAVAAARRPAAFARGLRRGAAGGPGAGGGREGRLFDCPPQASPHHDSTLVRWRERGTIMVVSVSGHSDLHRRLVLALAAHVQLVPPGK